MFSEDNIKVSTLLSLALLGHLATFSRTRLTNPPNGHKVYSCINAEPSPSLSSSGNSAVVGLNGGWSFKPSFGGLGATTADLT